MVNKNINKLLKEITCDKDALNYLKDMGGPYTSKIIELFKNKDDLSPDYISEKLKIKITNVRSALNSLHYRGIACYRKIKNDNDNKFNYYWDIKFKKMIEIILEKKSYELKKINAAILEKKDRNFFDCKNKCGELPFEIAAAYNFICPNCGKKLDIIENNLSKLKRNRTKIEKEMVKLNLLYKNILDNKKGFICE